MDGINNFLQRYINLHTETVAHKKEIIDLVKNKAGVRLLSKNIEVEVEKKRVTLKAAGPLRSELLLRKETISTVLKEAFDYTLTLL